MRGWLPLGVLAVTLVPLFASLTAQAAERPITAACRTDLARRVGVWQHNADIACACMFEGDGKDWKGWQVPGAAPEVTRAREAYVVDLMNRGVNGYSTAASAEAPGLTPNESRYLGNFVRVYPALLSKNKAVVQCFNQRCRARGCAVLMNDVSGTTPR